MSESRRVYGEREFARQECGDGGVDGIRLGCDTICPLQSPDDSNYCEGCQRKGQICEKLCLAIVRLDSTAMSGRHEDDSPNSFFQPGLTSGAATEIDEIQGELIDTLREQQDRWLTEDVAAGRAVVIYREDG